MGYLMNLKSRVIIKSDGIVYIDKIPFYIENIHLSTIIGYGANAVIIKGRDKELDIDIVVKVWLINPKDSRNKIIQGREESRKIAKLNHERIAKVYRSGIFENLWYYLVIEYINGITLREALKKNPDFSLRYDYWFEIVEGIKEAHKKDIYHGDLHSNNIMITQNNIKILDFGTSIFNYRYSLNRESKLIELLVQEIFYDSVLKDYQLHYFKSLKPKNCVSHCSAWVYIISLIRCIPDRSKDDYYIRSTLFNIAGTISSDPLFNIKFIFDKIVGILDSLEIKGDHIKSFLNPLIDLFLKETDQKYQYIHRDSLKSTENLLVEAISSQKLLTEKYLDNSVL